MTRMTVRLLLFVLVSGLLLGAIAACERGETEEGPTPDIQATIDAAVMAAIPTETPTPEPTNTPEPTEPPTPDIAATVAAAIAAIQPTAAPPTAVPEPTPVPTDTPVPTPTPTAVPLPTPTPLADQSSGPPCIIAGTVRIGGSIAGAGTMVFAHSQTGNIIVETQTNPNGRYVLQITDFDMVFDLFVGNDDTGEDTPATSRGCREIRDLSVR